MTFDGGWRAFQPHDFHDSPLAIQLRGNVFTHYTAHLIVVGTDKGGVFLWIGLAFKNDNGDAFVVGAVDGGRDGLHLVGGNNKQVNTRFHEAVYLLHLSLVAVESRSEAQFYIALQIGSHS